MKRDPTIEINAGTQRKEGVLNILPNCGDLVKLTFLSVALGCWREQQPACGMGDAGRVRQDAAGPGHGPY